MKTSGKKIYQQDDITIIHIHYNKIAQPYQRLVRLGFLYAYASEIKTLIIISQLKWRILSQPGRIGSGKNKKIFILPTGLEDHL